VIRNTYLKFACYPMNIMLVGTCAWGTAHDYIGGLDNHSYTRLVWLAPSQR